MNKIDRQELVNEVLREAEKIIATAVYFKLGNYECGIQSTGKRSSKYCVWCEIYDADKKVVSVHHLKDVYTGNWRKCQSMLIAWKKKCEKNKLIKIV